MCPLTKIVKSGLRKKAPSLKPVVIIGQGGLTENVQKAIEEALVDHELIKIRVNCKDRHIRKQLIAKICETQQAELIQAIGHTITIYRAQAVE